MRGLLGRRLARTLFGSSAVALVLWAGWLAVHLEKAPPQTPFQSRTAAVVPTRGAAG
jgi:hypothetical protein